MPEFGGRVYVVYGLFYLFEEPDAVAGNSDKARLVFAENYPRLQQIKKKYDPEVVFAKWLPITPA